MLVSKRSPQHPMRLSTKSIYGIRAMVALGLTYGYGPVSVAMIAEREEMSLPYLGQLLNRLRRHKLVNSLRGPKGGYTLSRAPSAISVRDIVAALEENGAREWLQSVPSAVEGRRHDDGVVTGAVWEVVAHRLADTLEQTTLEELVQAVKASTPEAALHHKYTFHI